MMNSLKWHSGTDNADCGFPSARGWTLKTFFRTKLDVRITEVGCPV